MRERKGERRGSAAGAPRVAASVVAELRRDFERRGIQQVKLGGFDIDGVFRGKYVSLEKFWGAAEGGFGFCDVIFGWDFGDELYDNSEVTGWHTGYPDTQARIDLGSYRVIPWEPDTAAFIVDFCEVSGAPLPVSPRQVLQRVEARARELKLKIKCGAEYEFFLFKETATSLREKGFRNLTTLSPGMFGYSWVRTSESATLVHALLDGLEAFGIPVEGFHTETGPGVFEAAIGYDDLLAAADKAALFKTAVKEIAARHGLIACFMAKWNPDLPGCSGHLHESVWNAAGDSLFAGGGGPHGLSPALASYVAGQVTLLPELAAIAWPTVNSYKRSVPNTWAPVTATWGIENRTCALRVIRPSADPMLRPSASARQRAKPASSADPMLRPSASAGQPAKPASSSATRVEFRMSGADMNPYLTMAASVAAGLHGLQTKPKLPAPVSGNAYQGARAEPLPRNLGEATALLRQSKFAREWLGDAFVEHFCRTREWEWRKYERAVTDWELARYFEAV